ncbi:putative BspA family leucine-rich repeat surface protein [Methylococcus capsulatus]|uniref:BspA family leucine-rich repeat surface protein n=1 Tax=Methylococcus capsulatus TaxID=414 RepID=A0AA35XZ05_METCP|nr:BspA family leucine-rich repeat surface protein [Methylococcus capsulatus]CAI8742055.1 putative BspA family leucine-rich repeat surface protein [Methylococcus capsulatus]
MSLLSGGLLGSRRRNPGSAVASWARHPDWLPLPVIGPTEEKFVGLFGVTNDSANFVALLAQGDYTVDWGDGTVENHDSFAVASHQYDYAAIPNGTLCSRGYKQVIITVTPREWATFTRIDLQRRHPSMTQNYAPMWLDLALGSPNLVWMKLGGWDLSLQFVERVKIVSVGNVTSTDSLYNSMTALEVVNDFNTANVTDASYMYMSCDRIKNVPAHNLSSCLYFTSFFENCSCLEVAPAINTAMGQDFSRFYYNCKALREAPALNTANGTNFNEMHRNNHALLDIPAYTLASAQTARYMLSACNSAKACPNFNTPNLTDAEGMFDNMHNLQFGPVLDLSQATNCARLFNNCYSLVHIPPYELSSSLANGFILEACTSLSKGAMTGTKVSIEYKNMRLGAAELNAIFAGLATGVTGQTIDITGNFGASDPACDRSIATLKGWTVVG